MIYRFLCLLTALFILSPSGCGYRFVDPLPGAGFALVSVGNSTQEPGLSQLLEEELRREGGFTERSSNRLSVVVTGFSETVDSVSSEGGIMRQKLTIELAWKVDGPQSSSASSGTETVSRSYPYSADPPTLDWNRGAAVKLLAKLAARQLLERLGELP